MSCGVPGQGQSDVFDFARIRRMLLDMKAHVVGRKMRMKDGALTSPEEALVVSRLLSVFFFQQSQHFVRGIGQRGAGTEDAPNAFGIKKFVIRGRNDAADHDDDILPAHLL